MWSIGRYNLRLSDTEFWGLTPREWFALVYRSDIDRARADRRTAYVVLALMEPHRDREKRPNQFTLDEFMLEPWPGRSLNGKLSKQQTPEQLWQAAEQIIAIFGGVDDRKNGSANGVQD